MPSFSASAASTLRPVSIISKAAFLPICRLSRWTPPAAAKKPTFTSGNANFAFSDAMIISHDSAVSIPPPIAKPFTAAIIGFVRSDLLVKPAKPLFGC